MIKEIMINGAESMGLTFDSVSAARFEKYYDLLVEKNKVMNLTAITEEDEVARLHFLDSMALFDIITPFYGKKIIDIGSGAGFPGLPLKIFDSTIDLTMLDALAKRIGFLTEVRDSLGIDKTECIHARAEEAAMKPNMRDSFDYAVSRAVARLNLLTELCLPFVKPGGAFIAMKSVDTEDEINEAKNAIKTLGGRIESVYDYQIPTTDIIHRAVVIKKLSPTPKGYPRRFAKIQKEPL